MSPTSWPGCATRRQATVRNDRVTTLFVSPAIRWQPLVIACRHVAAAFVDFVPAGLEPGHGAALSDHLVEPAGHDDR